MKWDSQLLKSGMASAFLGKGGHGVPFDLPEGHDDLPDEAFDEHASSVATLAPSVARPSLLLERAEHAYEEYCDRVADGETLDPDAYCEQFPDLKSALREMMHAHLFLEENSSLLRDLPSPGDENGDAAPVVRWPRAGEIFLRYRLMLELGKGAFAHVFLAAERTLGERLVVVKIALKGEAEAQVLGPIHHPNIVPIHSIEHEEATGLTAICMPYQGSATLNTVLEKITQPAQPSLRAQLILDAVKDLPHPLDPSAHASQPPLILREGTFVDGIRFLGAKLADALSFIHQRKIYHLDLKPSNVLMSPDGVPLLLDFNLCTNPKQKDPRLGGTVPYMSPEQLRAMLEQNKENFAALNARSDIFSLGVLLYQLLTGAHPFGPIPKAGSVPELCRLFLERQRRGAIPVCKLNPQVDPALGRLIERCLAFDPATRPESAATIAAELEQESKPQAPARGWMERNPRIVAAVFMSLLTLSILGFAVVPLRLPEKDRELAMPHGVRDFAAGREAYRQGQFNQAVLHLSKVVSAEKNHAEAYFMRGRAFQQMGASDPKNFSYAQDDYRMADEMVPDGRTKACIGFCLVRRGQHTTDYFKKAIDAGFGTAEVYNNQGYCQFKLKALPEAQASLDYALQLDNRLQAAWHNRARVYLEKGFSQPPLQPGATQEEKAKHHADLVDSLEKSIADIEKALEIGPASAELYRDVIWIYAVAAHHDSRKKDAVVKHLIQAKNYAIDQKSLSDPDFEVLQGLPDFRTLLNNAKAAPQCLTQLLVDPVREIR